MELANGIAIIGGGIAGLCLSLVLKKNYGIDSTIYESRREGYASAGWIALSSNALRILDNVGVYEQIRKMGYNSEKTTLTNRAGKVMGNLQQGASFGYPTVRLKRSYVRDALLKEAEIHKIRINYEKKFEKLVETQVKTSVYFEDGEVVDARIVIGADGLRSGVRSHLDTSGKPYYTGTMIIYGMIPKDMLVEQMKGSDQPLVEDCCLMFGKEGSFLIWPTDHMAQEIAYIVNLELPDRSKDEWRALDEDKVALRRLLETAFCSGGWPKQVEIMCRNTPGEEFMAWPVHLIPPPPSWKSPTGRVILIGDAAHAMAPGGGQGGCMALEDAETLAYVLSKRKNDGISIDLLQAWEDHRKQRVNSVIDFSNLSMRLRKASPNPIIQTMREWFIWCLLKFKGPEGYRWLYGYDTRDVISKL